MSILRDFWIHVVGVDKPMLERRVPRRPDADDVEDITRQAEAADEQAEAAEQEADVAERQAEAAEEQAEAAAFKAQAMERLAALVGPYKEAVAENGPDAQRLQALFDIVKTSVGKQHFTQAAEGLDLLEGLLDERATPPPDVLDDENGRPAREDGLGVAPRERGLGLADGQRAQAVSASGDQNTVTESFSPVDVVPDILKEILKGATSPQKVVGKIVNHTDQTLELDEQSVSQELPHGEFNRFPPDEIKPGAENGEFVAVSKTKAGATVTGVEGEIKYLLGDKQTVWTLKFNNPHFSSDNDTNGTEIKGPDAARFESVAHAGAGGEAVFTYTLKSKDGPGPNPDKPATDVNANCLITVTNNTQAVLTLSHQDNELGDFMANPASSLQPGASTSFVFVQTPHGQDPKQQGCKGSVTWDVGSPVAAVWRCEWDNPVGQKNTAKATLDPQTAGFKSLEQIGQGDENVPVAFTISGGRQGPPVIPVDPPVVPPVPPPETEPEFKPPVEEKQPTLRLGDKSADGWVEYLQQRLNRRLDPSPNLKEDGNFGQATLKAVLAYQRQEGIQVDGVVGNQTWAQLRLATTEAPSTDGRKAHTFVDKGIKARWLSEGKVAIYTTSTDQMSLAAVSVGDDTKLEGQSVNVFVTAPGSKRKGVVAKVGPPTHRTQTDEGDDHEVILANFTKKFPSVPPGAKVEDYVVEAYFDQALGGDFWSSTVRGIIVK